MKYFLQKREGEILFYSRGIDVELIIPTTTFVSLADLLTKQPILYFTNDLRAVNNKK